MTKLVQEAVDLYLASRGGVEGLIARERATFGEHGVGPPPGPRWELTAIGRGVGGRRAGRRPAPVRPRRPWPTRSAIRGRSRQERLQLPTQRRDFHGRDLPHPREIDFPVAMDQSIP